MAETHALDKLYDPRTVETEIYRRWEKSGAFTSQPDGRPHGETFTIVIPPPNVTGALHLGHALNNTLQDILVRYHRMRGFNTLWQPGTDHAGIATQAVVERRIRENEGKSRHELGREELVKRIWEWKDQYESRILSQLKLMGCSCDWSRTRFTLDEGLALAVRHMFFKLFKDGLIFRGKRLVNWDTQLQTAVSDDEVYYETVQGHFWHIAYPVIDPQPGEPDHVIIATTRPETMLGDTAVAVHPDPGGFFEKQETRLRAERGSASDKEAGEIDAKLESLAARRGSHLKQLEMLARMASDGRMLLLPLVDRRIPLIRDEWADPTKGSGCVKITPAHDPNDYEVGLRHNLPMINVLTPDGKIAPIVEPDPTSAPTKPDRVENIHGERYAGLSFTHEGREKIVSDLDAQRLLREVEDHEHELGHSDRSKHPIEPYLSDQWFVKTADVGGPWTSVHEKTDQIEPRTEVGSQGVRLADGKIVAGLAQAAMDAVNDGRVKVFPPRYAKSYLDWLGEKRDWCISRQLWWGHRINTWSFTLSDDGAASLLDGERLSEREQTALDCWKSLPLDPSLANRVSISTSELSARWFLDRSDAVKTIQENGARDTGKELIVNILHPSQEHELVARLEENGFDRSEDVLDTWFSSGLWPFSTLGWPEQTPHLKQYYPGSVLCTSRDIITNWVARMVMFGLYAMGEVPFDHVYIHPKILDGRGETMSKSKGNGVDPVDVIHTHGADALRYTMADMTTETQDIRMPVEYICPHCGSLVDQQAAIKAEQQARKSRGEKLTRKLQPADCHRVKCTNKQCAKEFGTQWADDKTKKELTIARETSDKFDLGRNFCNKLWNAARFALMHLEGVTCDALDVRALPPEDRWILARLSQTIRNYHQHIAHYRFAASVRDLRDFFWECLCDWYIELTKPRMTSEPRTSVRAASPASGTAHTSDPAKQILAFCLDQVLRLWHPTIPFITERLWQHLNAVAPIRGLPGIANLSTDTELIVAVFPPLEGYPTLNDDAIIATFADLQDATRGVRELRSQCDVSPKDRPSVTVIVSADNVQRFEKHAHILKHMAGIGKLTVATNARRPKNAGSATIKDLHIYVHDISDDDAERKRAQKNLQGIEKQIKGKQSKLSNEKFVANAKPEVVELERTRLAELTAERDSLTARLEELAG